MIRTPRSTTTTAPMPITRALAIELYVWNAANKKARDEYRDHPFISPSHCETCGQLSQVNPCWRCAEETK